MAEHSKADLAVAHFANRKVATIVTQTWEAFVKASQEWERLSAEELVGIGFNLLMNITVLPLEEMARDRNEMREEIAKELYSLVMKGSEGVN
jgi:hypothetical protein